MRTKIFLVFALFFVSSLISFPLHAEPKSTEKPLQVAVMVSDDHYDADKLLGPLVEQLGKENHWETHIVHGKGTSTFSNIETLEKADVLVIYVRRLTPPKSQMDTIRKFVDSGRGVVALRTASHGFHPGKAELKVGFDHWKEFDKEVLGCFYDGHGRNELGSDVRNVKSQQNSPILKDVVPENWHSVGSLYYLDPLNEDATIYQTASSSQKKEMPLTWTRMYKKTRIAHTALGHQEDFKEKPFQMLLRNLILWAGRPDGSKDGGTKIDMKHTDEAVTLDVNLEGAEDLYLVAMYGNDSYDSDQAIWAEPTLYDRDGNTIRLTTFKPESVKVGWGNLILDKNHQDNRLSIAGKEYEFGFWAHAPSILHFKLDGKYVRFKTKAGIDTGSQRGTVGFEIRNNPTSYPTVEEYTRNMKPVTPPAPVVPPVGEVVMKFNPGAAKILLDKGVKEILFIRRLTNTGTHVYTEYVDSRWLPGGGLCVLNLETGQVREIVPEMTKNGVVGWFDLSHDAQKIVFDFKKGPDDGYRIYEVGVNGTGLRQLTFPEENEPELVEKYRRRYHHGTDDMEPCYLPDGGIVFASTRCQFSVLCDSYDGFTVKNLYRMNGDGGEMRPLTYSPLSEATPTLMHDGRVLYHRWEYVDKAAGNAKALWAMNPDGSASVEIYGNTISFPETMIQARSIPGDPNKIVMLGASHCCPNNAIGTVIVVDTTKNIRSIDAMRYVTSDVAAFHHNGFHFKDENGEWVHDMTGRPGRLFRNPYPLSNELFLVSHKPKGLSWNEPAGYDLSILDENGRETILLKDPSVSLWEAYPLTPRSLPGQTLSEAAVDTELAEQGLARCIVTDIYVGMEHVKRGEVKYIRILEQVPRSWSARKDYGDDSWGTTHAHSAVGNGSLSIKVQHGIVPVEEDGSAHFVVPAGRAIYFQALDEDLCAIQTERTYVNYNPGETRSCVGCHETPDMAPPRIAATVPKALRRAASYPGAQPTQSESQLVFDYDRKIQPIFDRHCVSCHDPNAPDGAQAALDLRGDPQGTYCVSYNMLVNLSKTDKQILGFRKYRDEDAAMNGIEYLPPYHSGALTSPLAAMVHGWKKISPNDESLNEYVAGLVESHAELKLTDVEKLTLTNWLDINCQYHPSYFGRLHERFRNDPLYRPAVSFEDVRQRELPKRFSPAQQAMNRQPTENR